MSSFGRRSLANLSGVDSDLQRLFKEVVKSFDCSVLEGLRTPERQRELFEADPPRTHTLNSKHLTGEAVDVVPYPIDWEDVERQYRFAACVYDTAMRMGIKVKWGGMFRRKNGKPFYDSPHWQIIKG